MKNYEKLSIKVVYYNCDVIRTSGLELPDAEKEIQENEIIFGAGDF